MSFTSSNRLHIHVEHKILAQQAHLDLLFQRCWAIVLSVYEHAEHNTFHYSVLQDGKSQAKFKLEVEICLSSDINNVYPRQISDANEADIAPRKFLTSLERNTLFILSDENSNSSEDGTDIFDNDSTTSTGDPAVSHGASTLYTPNQSSDDEISLSAMNDKLDELIKESQELFENTGTIHFVGMEGLTLTFHVPGASRMQLRNMLRTFEIVVHGITLDPNIKISDLELCSTNDEMQLHTWNSLEPSTGSDKGILSAILDYATEEPGRMAVEAWDGNLSYRDLENLSSQLAEHLVKRGLEYRLESPQYVPLLFEKSYRTVLAMVAVAKVGCAFVLLDPSQPLKRLQSICDQIHAPMVVCSASLIETAAALSPSTVSLDSKMDIFDRNTAPVPSTRCRDQARNHALYGVFTSGSTGRPKGITVDHDAFVSCAHAYIEKVGMNKQTRTFQFASYAFDVSISDTLNSLLVGGCLCIPSDVERLQSVATCIQRLEPTWADLTPSLLRHLSLQDLHTIKTVVVSGEALPRDVVGSWGEQIRLINVYGPAECSVQSTMCTNVSTDSPSNIGTAIVGATWIVDPSNHDKLRPIGAIGELLIEGPHLGRGYLDEPTKTQQAFIHAPAWLNKFREPALCDYSKRERLYCTGDLVQYEADGSLRYIGRKDTQVKLRGQRIELEEIEHHLRESLPAQVDVAAEVISMHQDSAPAVTLVAFVTRRQEKLDTSSTLPFLKKPCKNLVNDIFLALEKVQKSIPEYMIPGLFLSASYIPLTPSGKVDRRRLREEASQLSMKEVKQYMVEDKVSYTIQTELTEKVASSFAMVLNVPIEDMSPHADFFALGGDSISAMRVVSQLRKTGYILETGDILRRRTIGKIAAAVKPASQLSVSTRPGPKSDIESGLAFDLSPIQQMFFTDSPNGENYFNQSFFVAVSRNVDMVELRNAARALVGRHAMLRARFNRSDKNIWTQRITQNIEESFFCQEYQMHKRQDANPIMNSIQRGFNLERGPIFSISLFRIQSEDKPYIFINTHHAVIDLVSYRIILEDLEQHLCMGSFASHGPIPSFEWWCRLQADFAKEELYPRVALPKDVHINHDFLQKYWDLQKIPNTYGNAHFASLFIQKDVTNDILARANDAFHTEPVELLNAALLHSFMLVFADREAPVMFNEGHGREPWDPSIDLSRTVGWFTTIWPIPVDMEQLNVNNIFDLVRRVKDGRRQVPGKGFPYFASRYLNPKGQEQFQKHKMEIVFNFHGKFQQFERDGALLQQVPWEFDLPSDYGPETVLPGVFEITCAVSGGQFKFEFIYGKHLAHQERIQLWMSQCASSLEEIARQLTQTPAAVPTLVDFPLLNWGYEDLDQLQETVSGLGIRMSDVESVYPCLPTQVGILLSRAKESSLYQTGSILELKHRNLSQISVDTLASAWERTIAHHAVLRTVMIPSDNLSSPFNNVVIKPKVIPLAFSKVRYQEFEDEALERASILNMIRKDSGGLSEQALAPYQIKLYTSSKAQSVFCRIIFNHAIMDGWSSNVLVKDWVKEYNSIMIESPITTYNDYAAFVLQNTSSRTYWQEYLNDAESCTFPALVDYGKNISEDIYTVDIAFSYPVDSLQQFVKTHGITIASLYHVAWALLLKIYCERDDICFGYATSGRDIPLPDIEKTVGMLANTLPCRIKISENCSILALLQEMQLNMAQAASHQHVSLVDIQNEIKFSGSSLFNTAVSIQHQEVAENESHTSDRELIVEEIDEIDPTEVSIMPAKALRGETRN
ncbi:hypothetical protein NLG97_g1795 [Lecanicillium saksenae]|uniref:Uncharacterized protein n=1 Tax=Lecanicillium saksenae TaxID=468837 RepID=A0ACC1R2Z7_9HYPO|nr:hypothetical protein NLG97_g1795 [Lecanicillium saksenae]